MQHHHSQDPMLIQYYDNTPQHFAQQQQLSRANNRLSQPDLTQLQYQQQQQQQMLPQARFGSPSKRQQQFQNPSASSTPPYGGAAMTEHPEKEKFEVGINFSPLKVHRLLTEMDVMRCSSRRLSL